MKRLLAGALGLMFVASSFGCASGYRAKRDYHNRRAKQELRRGDIGDAIEQKGKAVEAERDARNAPIQ
jgi:hypothetical protein